MKSSPDLNKYRQSVITRRWRDLFVITNQRRWVLTRKKGVFSIRINVNQKKRKLNLTEQRKKVKKNMLVVEHNINQILTQCSHGSISLKFLMRNSLKYLKISISLSGKSSFKSTLWVIILERPASLTFCASLSFLHSFQMPL